MEPVWKLKLDSDEVIMADDTTRDLSSLMSKIKQTAEFKHSKQISNTEDNNDVSQIIIQFRIQIFIIFNFCYSESSPGADGS